MISGLVTRRFTPTALALGVVLLVAPAAQAAGSVTFVAPQNYRDGNLAWGPVDQRLTLEGLERIFRNAAARWLPAGYEIDVTLLDVDLAGKIDPLRARSGELRVMRQDTWPSMTLRYSLRRGGKVIARGEDTLRAMNYLMDPLAIRSSEPLRFEKAMIGDWFRTRFATLEAKRPGS